MNNKKLIDGLYVVDEFGRIIIENDDLLKTISGARRIFDSDNTNVGCGANSWCPNWTCNEVPPF